MPAKVKEIKGDDDCRIVEFEVTDDNNNDDNINIEYYEYFDESDAANDIEIEIETEENTENKN